MSNTHQLVISFALCLPALAGISPIGMVTSNGDIEVGRVRMPGTATLYEGSVVETGNAPAQLSLRNGSVVRLSTGAKATIHSGLLLLERGTGQLDTKGEYAIRVQSVTVVPSTYPARARVQLSGDGAIQVAALTGSFSIQRAGASSIMTAGTSLKFAAEVSEAGAAAPSEFKGCMVKSDKGLLLRLDTTKDSVALQGGSTSAKEGDRVTVVGKPDTVAAPVKGAAQVVRVLRLTVDSHHCSSDAAVAAVGAGATGAAGAAGAAGAGAAGAATTGAAAGTIAGLSTATVAVIGVAAASAALIPTIALTTDSGSSTSSISPSSR